MNQVDLVIRGAKIVSPDQVIEASVAIDGERIVVVGHDDLMPSAKEVLQADGLYLLPGAIDSHVHFRDPGYPHKETWLSGSAAAACGGVTTVFDMPNTNPPTGTLEALRLKQKAAESSYVDYGIHGLLGDDTIQSLEALLEGGVTSFKAFVGNTFGNLPAPSDGALLEGFEILAPLGCAPSCTRRTRRFFRAGRHAWKPLGVWTRSRIWRRGRRWQRSKQSGACWRSLNGLGRACTLHITAPPMRCSCCEKQNGVVST